jgi:hypothetical protein
MAANSRQTNPGAIDLVRLLFLNDMSSDDNSQFIGQYSD